MATTVDDLRGHESERVEKVAAGGSLLELIAGAGAVVLPILALVGVLAIPLTAVAFIAIGGAMMFKGGGVSAQTRTLTAGGGTTADSEVIGGLSAEMLGGAATSALGILALLGISPTALLSVAAIVAGGATVLGAGTTARLASYRYGAARLDENKRQLLHESVQAAAGTDVLVGLGAVVLGILVLANVGGLPVQRTLIEVAALSLGGALFLNGTTVGARMVALMQH